MKNVTVGLSPKALLAGVLPALGTLAAIAITWAVTGTLDRAELTIALTGAAASVVSALGAWAGSPGAVQASPDPEAELRDLHDIGPL